MDTLYIVFWVGSVLVWFVWFWRYIRARSRDQHWGADDVPAPSPRATIIPMMQHEDFSLSMSRDTDGNYHWWLKNTDGVTVAKSIRGYPTRALAVRAFHRTRSAVINTKLDEE